MNIFYIFNTTVPFGRKYPIKNKVSSKCRYAVTFVGFWIMFLLNGYKINTSVNVVAMLNNSALVSQMKEMPVSCIIPGFNSTASTDDLEDEGEFIWSTAIQGYMQSSYFLGFVIFQIPSGLLAQQFGHKWFLFFSSFVMALATFLTPLVARADRYALLGLQFFRGSSQGFLLPAISVMVANWFTKTERGQMYNIIQSGNCLGSCLGGLFSGLLCASAGKWPSSFYVFGAIGVLLSLLILFCVYESPEVHPMISKAELDFILSDQETKLSKKRPNPPWGKMLTSVKVYALMIGSFSHIWSLSQFLIVQSTFIGTILHFPIDENGYIEALTFLLQFVTSLVTAPLSSLMIKRNIASLDYTRKFWNLVSSLGFSVCLLGVYFAGCNRLLSIIFSILSGGFTGFGFAGSCLMSADMSPTFAGILKGIGLTFGSLSCVILPLVVGYLTDGMQTIEQWNKVFFISIGVVMSTSMFFTVFASAEVQPWNSVEEVNITKKQNGEIAKSVCVSKEDLQKIEKNLPETFKTAAAVKLTSYISFF